MGSIENLLNFFEKLYPFSAFKDFSARSDSRKIWNEIFPDQSEQIDIFLSFLDEAFMVPKRYQFRILPEDTLGDLYKRRSGMIDQFQIEIMVDRVFKHFGYELLEEEISLDLSVKAIFSKIANQ